MTSSSTVTRINRLFFFGGGEGEGGGAKSNSQRCTHQVKKKKSSIPAMSPNAFTPPAQTGETTVPELD